MNAHIRKYYFLLITPLILVLGACGSLLIPTENGASTDSSGNEAIVRTMTARALVGNSNSELSTAIAKSTAYSMELTANAQKDQDSFQATATAGAQIFLELPAYGINPQNGWAAWIHDPITLKVGNFHDYKTFNDYPEYTGKDFVLVADITLTSDDGNSGCGFVIRSDGDKEEPNQYQVLLTRGSMGSVVFSALKDGDLVNFNTFYPGANDNSFGWENDSTNRFAVVAQQEILKFFTNGVNIGEIDIRNPPYEAIPQPDIPTVPAYIQSTPTSQFLSGTLLQDLFSLFGNSNVPIEPYPYQGYPVNIPQINYQYEPVQYYDGFLSYIAFNQSGYTNCTFENGWLFIIDNHLTPTPTNIP